MMDEDTLSKYRLTHSVPWSPMGVQIVFIMMPRPQTKIKRNMCKIIKVFVKKNQGYVIKIMGLVLIDIGKHNKTIKFRRMPIIVHGPHIVPAQ